MELKLNEATPGKEHEKINLLTPEEYVNFKWIIEIGGSDDD